MKSEIAKDLSSEPALSEEDIMAIEAAKSIHIQAEHDERIQNEIKKQHEQNKNKVDVKQELSLLNSKEFDSFYDDSDDLHDMSVTDAFRKGKKATGFEVQKAAPAQNQTAQAQVPPAAKPQALAVVKQPAQNNTQAAQATPQQTVQATVQIPVKEIVQLAVSQHPKLAEATMMAAKLEPALKPATTKELTMNDLHAQAGKNAMKDIKDFLMLKEGQRKQKN